MNNSSVSGTSGDSASHSHPDSGSVQPVEVGKHPRSGLRHDFAFIGYIATQFLGAFNDNLFKQLMLLLAIPTALVAGEAAGVSLQVGRLWIASLGCIGLAVLGTLTSLLLRTTPVADPHAPLNKDAIWVPQQTRDLMRNDPALFGAVLASCAFWMIGGLALQAVNSLGKTQLGLSDGRTSFLTAFISVGIGAGAVLAGFISRGGSDPRLVKIGNWAVVAISALIALFVPLAERALQVPQANLELGADLQGIATVVFGLPFVVFGGVAGWLADRISKRQVMVWSKVAEIAIMILGLVGFLTAPSVGMSLLWFVLFLMGTQSAFFGPGKYGILPEMLRTSDLPKANGLVCMTTFLAIILGTALAGVLKDLLGTETVVAQKLTEGQAWIFYGCLPLLAILGIAAAFFAIPVQVFLQSRPPEEMKGRTIAFMNQANFLAIVCAGILYQLIDWLLQATGWPRSTAFAIMAILYLPVAIWYRLPEMPSESSSGSNSAMS